MNTALQISRNRRLLLRHRLRLLLLLLLRLRLITLLLLSFLQRTLILRFKKLLLQGTGFVRLLFTHSTESLFEPRGTIALTAPVGFYSSLESVKHSLAFGWDQIPWLLLLLLLLLEVKLLLLLMMLAVDQLHLLLLLDVKLLL